MLEDGGQRSTVPRDAEPIVDHEEGALVKEERIWYDARIEIWRGILQQLMAVDIGNITPVQALNLLNEMQIRVKRSSD
jgi:hypothetical protein